MNYYRIQTNRAAIKKLLAGFKSGLVPGEYLIAPRPLPRELFKYHVAFCRVSPGGRNEALVSGFSNHQAIDEQEFSSQVSATPHFWKVGSAGA